LFCFVFLFAVLKKIELKNKMTTTISAHDLAQKIEIQREVNRKRKAEKDALEHAQKELKRLEEEGAELGTESFKI